MACCFAPQQPKKPHKLLLFDSGTVLYFQFVLKIKFSIFLSVIAVTILPRVTLNHVALAEHRTNSLGFSFVPQKCVVVFPSTPSPLPSSLVLSYLVAPVVGRDILQIPGLVNCFHFFHLHFPCFHCWYRKKGGNYFYSQLLFLDGSRSYVMASIERHGIRGHLFSIAFAIPPLSSFFVVARIRCIR